MKSTLITSVILYGCLQLNSAAYLSTTESSSSLTRRQFFGSDIGSEILGGPDGEDYPLIDESPEGIPPPPEGPPGAEDSYTYGEYPDPPSPSSLKDPSGKGDSNHSYQSPEGTPTSPKTPSGAGNSDKPHGSPDAPPMDPSEMNDYVVSEDPTEDVPPPPEGLPSGDDSEYAGDEEYGEGDGEYDEENKEGGGLLQGDFKNALMGSGNQKDGVVTKYAGSIPVFGNFMKNTGFEQMLKTIGI